MKASYAEYGSPEEVAADARLSRDEKVELLRQWEYDQREIAVAEEEGMRGPEPDLLRRIHEALVELEAAPPRGFGQAKA